MIDLQQFSGMAPLIDENRLPPQMAKEAANVNLESRTVKPWRQPLTVMSGLLSGAITSIYRFGQDLISDTQYWFVKDGDLDFVKAPQVGDQTEKTIFTGDGAPKWTNNTLALTGGSGGNYPYAYRDLGVEKPTATPTSVASGTAISANDFEYWAHKFTWVTAYGEESAPSPASAAIKVFLGQVADVTNFGTPPAGTGSVTGIRLYRAVASGGSGNYFFVKEVPVGTPTITDNVGENVGGMMNTDGWEPPPSDGFGIVAMANGIHVLFSGFDVCPSEQYIPYAYKKGNRLACDYKIIGGAAVGSSVVVLTMGTPYLLQGTTPESLQLIKLDHPQSCVSKRSIVTMAGAVFFASPDGLCAIDDNGNVTVVTEAMFTRDQWQALNPESMHAYCYNGQYFCFYDTGSKQGGFVYEPTEGDAALSYLDLWASAGYTDLAQDHLFLHIGTEIKRFDDSGILTSARWHSGRISTGQRVHHPFVKVKAKAYPVTIKLYAENPEDGTLTIVANSVSVTSPKAQRMPRAGKFEKFEVEVSTTVEVSRVTLGTADELKALE